MSTYLNAYLLKEHELSGFMPDSREHDSVLEDLDDLWWKMSADERKVAERSKDGKWITVKGWRHCPFCGDKVEGGGASVRCMACMRDVVPEVIECE